MIGGFPHRYEDSFFHQAIARLKKETSHQITSTLFTLHAFPVTRVPKHLQARCLAAKPDIVVLQFGSSDLIVPVRRRMHRGSVAPIHHKVSTEMPDLFDRWRWTVRGITGDVLRLTPVSIGIA